jgi:hypothetical protein
MCESKKYQNMRIDDYTSLVFEFSSVYVHDQVQVGASAREGTIPL